ncbi:MAG TPA: fibronectin type III domain-containing protein [Rhodopila sp.]
MPTISQLPSANTISAADEVPISQGGTARATSVGALLASAQPAIIVASPSLLGRTSLGSGGPEQVDVGAGIDLVAGTLVANGLDHAGFQPTSTLSTASELVISNQGSPMLMPASLLRGLFSAGQNVAIDPNGVISATGTLTGGGQAGNPIGDLQALTGLAAQDLVGVSHAGSDYAISYSNFLGGVTIDQAAPAGAASDSDTIWVAQGSNVMAAQSFSAIWIWIAQKLSMYKAPVVEITTDTHLDTTIHNGRILVCSQPITLTPLVNNMGSGFQCTVINASSGSIALGSGFVSSNGSLLLAPWQSASLSCATYSGGTIAFAAMPTAASGTAPPGQVSGLSSLATTPTTITLSWQSPSSGGVVLSYIVQFRPSGTTAWNTSAPVLNATSCQLTALQAATSYDVVVSAQNTSGVGAASAILTVVTASIAPPTLPLQVTGLTANPTSSSTVQLGWAAQTGSSAATSFTVHYKVSGSSDSTSTVTGMTGTGGSISGLQAGTSYDFSVNGVNGVGAGPASATVTAVTLAASAGVTSITWIMVPAGPYAHASGTIGVNAQVSPADSPIQFGFSASATTPPTSWSAATHVNSNLWGAYVPTPMTAGSWYAWAEGLDGSAPTVVQTAFLVQ